MIKIMIVYIIILSIDIFGFLAGTEVIGRKPEGRQQKAMDRGHVINYQDMSQEFN
jgi:hypothetical protein